MAKQKIGARCADFFIKNLGKKFERFDENWVKIGESLLIMA
ncbi:hypothetical protein [Moraxella pluranimalium]|nr:hypothetical protein [Moraxella pluranimalium]